MPFVAVVISANRANVARQWGRRYPGDTGLGAGSRDEHRTVNIELPTSNEKERSVVECSMLNVDCSMFASRAGARDVHASRPACTRAQRFPPPTQGRRAGWRRDPPDLVAVPNKIPIWITDYPILCQRACLPRPRHSISLAWRIALSTLRIMSRLTSGHYRRPTTPS